MVGTRTSSSVKFNEAELKAAFDAVKGHDWKGPIVANIDVADLEVTLAAITFYTATDAKVYPSHGDTCIVEAAGYRAGPAGDH